MHNKSTRVLVWSKLQNMNSENNLYSNSAISSTYPIPLPGNYYMHTVTII